MAATIGTSAQIDNALRRAFSEISVRPKPETKMTDVITALATHGVTAEMEDGILVLKQGDNMFNTAICLRGLASKAENSALFVTAADNPHDWTTKMKTDFISQHGADAWARKANGPVLTPSVAVLDANMTRANYQNLTRDEKIQFIREYGDIAVSRVMQKAK
jgi:hypothetical protein